ncbi:hypothetical protein DY000_02034000 [Brassica cretica]|uniref:Uncharacterized protein n=1 Tax=Brassica cretica TaxID=69181 RepID=A0ABQ7DY07_BRACR|nr:hypothetical protein DY000_02034000 [Brassica cretica]
MAVVEVILMLVFKPCKCECLHKRKVYKCINPTVAGSWIAGNLKDPYCVHIWFWGRKFHGWTGIHFNRMILAIAGARESLVCFNSVQSSLLVREDHVLEASSSSISAARLCRME